MKNKMKNKIIPKICLIATAILICSAVLGMAFANKSKTFVGIDGRVITVDGYREVNSSPNSMGSKEHVPNVGDRIVNEAGEEEVVFAVNEDGSYITATPEMYEEAKAAER